MSTALVWFRRDLRLADHPALAAAVAHAERVVAVYVHSPEDDGEWRAGAASDWWLHHSLLRLDEALRPRGIGLTVRRGPPARELSALVEETGATRIHWNRRYEPAAVARDAPLQAELRSRGLTCESFGGPLLCEPWQVRTAQGGPYKVFTPFWRACQAQFDTLPAPLPAPARLHGPRRAPRSVPIPALGLLPQVRWDAGLAARWAPGEAGGHARLDEFCNGEIATYDEDRNRPDRPASSRLSPHLHFGELTARQCLVAARNAVVDRPEARKSAEAFVREFGWRDFAHHLLHHFPHTANAPLDERFARFAWSDDESLLEAWRRGRTGYPIVDAGMRELWSTGWMHNRVRMIVASLLTKNLRQPWLAGARWFWDTLVDADLASNTLGWQWTAGCGADAAPFFRIFNPVLQAERYDPQRAYLRRWLPELAQLPDAWIHRPWQAPSDVLLAAGVTLGKTYPRPIVDLAASRREALAAYARIREPVARHA
ncbi:MAG TPA: deoxyribodipyrimidine photo-lyase [Steroidobacteraceae bacterium]|nr:deoxyribodipyrimidine photo-lyase [Steroidobacteraceae bacterium]